MTRNGTVSQTSSCYREEETHNTDSHVTARTMDKQQTGTPPQKQAAAEVIMAKSALFIK